jgi:cytochrome c peroxidase
MKALFIFLVAFQVSAQTKLDLQLKSYVEKFNLKPIAEPGIIDPELFKLGQMLFTDRILSGNNNISCVECHHPRVMTHDGLPLSIGEGSSGIEVNGQHRMQGLGKVLARNTPALFNLGNVDSMFWDGRVSFDKQTKIFTTPVQELNGSHPLRSDITGTLTSALAAQALFPMVNHDEMRGEKGSNPIADAKDELEAWDLIVKKVLAEKKYQDAFEKVFPGEKINIGHLGEAIAAFQKKAFSSSNTAYDRYLRGDLGALSEVQKIGMDVFFSKGQCGRCHNGEHLSNFEFHNIGTPQIGPGKNNGDDLGRFDLTQNSFDLYSFKVPALRNVALTAPYMHNGSFKTLAQVIEHYDVIETSLRDYKLVNNWKSYKEKISDHNHDTDDDRINSLSHKLNKNLGFTEEEEKALNVFLTSALTDDKFLKMEVEGDYKSFFRLQLKESGYSKLHELYGNNQREEEYYYFDLYAEGGFALRALMSPIRLILIKKSNEISLVFREQAYKTAFSENAVVTDVNFNRSEYKKIEEDQFSPIAEAYQDMFKRIYTYNDGNIQQEIPVTELDIIKSDLLLMNQQFHELAFDGAAIISDQMNISQGDLFYVPTSFNSKKVDVFTLDVAGKSVQCHLQKSFIRNERGGLEVTYSLEMETDRILKADLSEFGKELYKKLEVLNSGDIGGGSPSPSNLTLKVLKQVL